MEGGQNGKIDNYICFNLRWRLRGNRDGDDRGCGEGNLKRGKYMETATNAFADWWSTIGFTCEEDEGLASRAFHAGLVSGQELDVISIRDHFAVAALPCATEVCLAFKVNNCPFDEKFLARMAYVMADAMMEARKPK